jgi:hypothetical protein
MIQERDLILELQLLQIRYLLLDLEQTRAALISNTCLTKSSKFLRKNKSFPFRILTKMPKFHMNSRRKL